MKKVALAASVVALVVFLVWRVRREAPVADARREQPVASVAPAPAVRSPALPPIAVVPNPALGVAGVSTDDPLTAYKKQSVYPPTSRPLSSEHADLLAPNKRHELPGPTEAKDGSELLFTADRYFVVGS